jgi:hypothetical protein
MVTELAIRYVRNKFGISLENFIKQANVSSDIDVENEKQALTIIKKENSGLLLKHQLGLDEYQHVYIRKMIRTNVDYFEIYIDTLRMKSIPQSLVRNVLGFKSNIQSKGKLETRTFTPIILIETFNGHIPANSIIIVYDLAGHYYTKLKEGRYTVKEERLVELNYGAFAGMMGYTPTGSQRVLENPTKAEVEDEFGWGEAMNEVRLSYPPMVINSWCSMPMSTTMKQ